MIHFLVVDDEPMVLKDVKETLAKTVPKCEIAAFSSPLKALEYVREHLFEVAFLDIEMGRTNGIVLAKQLKDIQPQIHIIFVTSHSKYALEAFSVHATGYLMKPVLTDDILRELTFLYGEELSERGTRIRIQTFGGFAIFVDEKPITFRRAKSKELLAYLVYRRGTAITTPQACAVLWEDMPYDRKQKNYFQIVLFDLRTTLREAGIEHILVRSRNSLSIDPSQFECDSYQFMQGDPRAINSYHHDYMCDYSWSEFMVGLFEKGDKK